MSDKKVLERQIKIIIAIIVLVPLYLGFLNMWICPLFRPLTCAARPGVSSCPPTLDFCELTYVFTMFGLLSVFSPFGIIILGALTIFFIYIILKDKVKKK
jgi:hypothetical protein